VRPRECHPSFPWLKQSKRIISATTQPKIMAAGKKYRNAGIPIRNITVLMTATMAPAMPPPPDIFDTFICGVGSLFLILHLPTPRYHRLRRRVSVAESLKVQRQIRSRHQGATERPADTDGRYTAQAGTEGQARAEESRHPFRCHESPIRRAGDTAFERSPVLILAGP
jgi:hypothetical protein